MSDSDQVGHSIRRNLVVGLALILFVVGGLGAWAGTAELAGAVIASGKLVVESSVKKVQHPTGGIIGELLVREGERVKAGEVLLRLDATQTKANLGIVVDAIDELSARKARLQAERDGADELTFPVELLSRLDIPDVERIVSGERRLFALRRSSREGEKSQLKKRISQLENEIGGLEQQVDAKEQEITLIEQELEGVRELWKKNLIQLTRLTTLEREGARLEGERGQLVASIAKAKGKIAEIELQIIQIDQNLRSEVGEDLADVRGKLSELNEKKVAAEDQLKRIDIRAPRDGVVHALAVHTVGGVIAPGALIMLIVPDADSLIVEAKVAPADIDQLHVEQAAVLRFTAFNRRETPELIGLVNQISADLTEDERTGSSYYVVRLSIPKGELEKLKGLALIPGMPVEAFIQTGQRTVLSYLVKPMGDFFAHSLREG